MSDIKATSVEVTAATFFGALRKSSSDIMPSVAQSPPWDAVKGYVSTWSNQRTGDVIGYSFGVGEKTYLATPSFFAL